MKKLELTNLELLNILSVFEKMLNIEFEDFAKGLKVANQFTVIEDALKPFNKLKTAIQERVQKDGETDKIKEDYNKLMMQKIFVDFEQIDTSVIKGGVLKGFDILIITKLNALITEGSEKEPEIKKPKSIKKEPVDAIN